MTLGLRGLDADQRSGEAGACRTTRSAGGDAGPGPGEAVSPPVRRRHARQREAEPASTGLTYANPTWP